MPLGPRHRMMASRRRAILRGNDAAQKDPVEPKEDVKTWSLRLPKSLHASLKKLAKKEGRTMNKQVEKLIKDAVEGMASTGSAGGQTSNVMVDAKRDPNANA